MQGKTVVISGATSGIGEVAADRLALRGARIVFIARGRERGEATLKHLHAIAPGAEHAVHFADLSRLAEMKRVGADIAASESRIDVLVNNAGAVFSQRIVTEDGLELTFALNHMSYFVLTHFLKSRMGEGGRIVSTASAAHHRVKLHFDDLQSARHFPGYLVYGRSKLCNILFTRELARRLAGTGITANCQHPGFVATRFGGTTSGMFSFGIGLAKNFALSPEQGAQTMIYLASSPDVENMSGLYFHKSKPEKPSKEARSDADAARLWGISAHLAGLGG